MGKAWRQRITGPEFFYVFILTSPQAREAYFTCTFTCQTWIWILLMLEVWKWDLQCTHVYWDILRMALEHPQKQYRPSLYRSVFLWSRNLCAPFLSLFQTEVHNFRAGGEVTKKIAKPAVVYQAAWAITANYRITR